MPRLGLRCPGGGGGTTHPDRAVAAMPTVNRVASVRKKERLVMGDLRERRCSQDRYFGHTIKEDRVNRHFSEVIEEA